MINEKCILCGKQACTISLRVLNRNSENPQIVSEPLCMVCHVKETYSHSRECLKEYLKTFVEKTQRNQILDKKDVEFLNAVKSEFPEIMEKFPLLVEMGTQQNSG